MSCDDVELMTYPCRINNYTFNWDRMKSFEGDTGPYLQYAHVRLSSMARRNPQLHPLPPAEKIKTDLLVELKVGAFHPTSQPPLMTSHI